MNITLRDHFNRIEEDGPRRVLINQGGTAVKPHLAGYEPRIIYIREDGWSLGTSSEFEETARAMWKDDWIGVMRWDDEHGWRLEELP